MAITLRVTKTKIVTKSFSNLSKTTLNCKINTQLEWREKLGCNPNYNVQQLSKLSRISVWPEHKPDPINCLF